MNLLVEPQLFVAAKPGERPESCQDVGWVDPAIGADGRAGFAVADGATRAWDGQRWAELVIDASAKAILESNADIGPRWLRSSFADALDTARSRWIEENADLRSDADPIAALSYAKYRSAGGHCTLTIGSIGPKADGGWALDGFAVGDSPLVHLRPERAGFRNLTAFPVERSEQFDATPSLVSSRLPEAGTIVPNMKTVRIEGIRSGDVFIVMTDALAKWALSQAELGRQRWDLLARLDHAGFVSLIERTRATGELVADDVLLLRLAITDRPFRALPALPAEASVR